MLNGKYISTKSIIEEVYRDSGINEEIAWEDLVTWCFKGLELLGAPAQYVKKIVGPKNYPQAEFDNYKVELPCDFHSLRGIAVDGTVANYTHNITHHLLDGDCYLKDGTSTLNSGVTVGEGYVNDNFGNTFLAGSIPSSYGSYPEFDISNNAITFNQKEGEAVIFYNAVPIDDDGFPQIPENMAYQEALKWYIINKIDYRMMRGDPTNRGLQSLHELSMRKWQLYSARAIGEAKMPDLGMMENIKKQVLSLQPRVNEYNRFMAGIGRSAWRRRTDRGSYDV